MKFNARIKVVYQHEVSWLIIKVVKPHMKSNARIKVVINMK